MQEPENAKKVVKDPWNQLRKGEGTVKSEKKHPAMKTKYHSSKKVVKGQDMVKEILDTTDLMAGESLST